MKMNFKPNIGTTGRVIRLTLSLGLLLAGIFIPDLPTWGRVALTGSAAFVMFEALRGWCLLRACGIRTKF